MTHYVAVDLNSFDSWVEWGLAELERYLEKYAKFRALHGE